MYIETDRVIANVSKVLRENCASVVVWRGGN